MPAFARTGVGGSGGASHAHARARTHTTLAHTQHSHHALTTHDPAAYTTHQTVPHPALEARWLVLGKQSPCCALGNSKRQRAARASPPLDIVEIDKQAII